LNHSSKNYSQLKAELNKYVFGFILEQLKLHFDTVDRQTEYDKIYVCGQQFRL